MMASVAVIAVLAAGEGLFAGVPRFTLVDWQAVLFMGGSSAVGYALWLWALQNMSATNPTVFLAIGPVTAAVLGVLILGEAMTLGIGLAIALVGVGLWVPHRPDRQVARVSHQTGGQQQ